MIPNHQHWGLCLSCKISSICFMSKKPRQQKLSDANRVKPAEGWDTTAASTASGISYSVEIAFGLPILGRRRILSIESRDLSLILQQTPLILVEQASPTPKSMGAYNAAIRACHVLSKIVKIALWSGFLTSTGYFST